MLNLKRSFRADIIIQYFQVLCRHLIIFKLVERQLIYKLKILNLAPIFITLRQPMRGIRQNSVTCFKNIECLREVMKAHLPHRFLKKLL